MSDQIDQGDVREMNGIHGEEARGPRGDGQGRAGHGDGSGTSRTHGSEPESTEVADERDAEQPEFDTNPGTGFGFADASDISEEQRAERAEHVMNGGSQFSDANAAEDAAEDDAASTSEFAAEDEADAADAAAAYARASMRDFDRPAEEAAGDEGDEAMLAHRGEKPKQLVVVNDIPGEETRIAILEQGKLAQFFTERGATSTNVGSIYKARVVNVEPAIQAAFVDFGEGANGFLHISDLHPKYFPKKKGRDDAGDDGEGGGGGEGGEKVRTEKVGRKIPRRARPMMQEALKRGQEIIVQVLKEGIGSKGPTVTSYLSIPGRLLVMMPDMDNVGVSRKVDDEEGRRKMRKILDSLDLPKGFGFILRTAGFDATRTELARDAQYLTRLWQVMEKRMNAVGAPCQLYAEGDILLRTIRDSIDSSVDGIVVDSESAFSRARAFLEVVAPKAAAKVHYYDRRRPIFHAFDVERQVDMIHAREVPLPSGGALVFDQAEALVAIDVNSGRSRSARDSETNAYQTNQEAVDEIARQLRLRDLGGVVICDLIDMRASKHRRDIEERFKKHLSRDRAKTTVGTISEFGILELTRQRMRPSLRKTHYTDCPHCAGHGEIRMPDSVAGDAVRRIQLVFDMERVSRVEVVCSSKVAAVLLSRKRRAMVELEDLFSKKIDVRISEAIAVDRVDLYAYDDRGADVDIERPQKFQLPALSSFPTEIEEDDDEETGGTTAQQGSGGGRRRRRRRRKPAAADATSIILSGGFDDLPDVDEDEPSFASALEKKEREDREAARADREAARAEREAARAAREAAESDGDEDGEDGEGESSGAESEQSGEGGGRRKRRRRRRGRGGRDRDGASQDERGDERGNERGDDAGDRGGDRGGERRPAQAPVRKPVAPPPPPREPSDPIRVHAIAKEIELTSKEVLAKCAELGIEVKGHQSLLTGEQGDLIRKAYGKPPFDVPEPTPEPEADEGGDSIESDGQPSGDGEGRRKRRRRRRRGRGGRGGEPGGSDASGSGESGAERDPDDQSDRDDDRSDDEHSDDGRSADGDADGGSPDSDSEESDDGDRDSAGDADGERGGTGDDAGGGRKRRRRRRGGRGRNKNRDGGERGDQAVGDRGGDRSGDRGGNRPPQAEGGRDRDRRDGGRDGGRDGRRNDGRGGRDGRDGRRNDGRDRRDGSGGSQSSSPNASSGSAPTSTPAPSAASSTPSAPKPRSLYGGRVRKLSPGERGAGGGDE